MRNSRLPPTGYATMTDFSDLDARRRRLRFRAWHRGTKEADLMIGSFCDRHVAAWTDDEIGWFEALLQETDADILDWLNGAADAPERYRGPLLDAFRKLDFVKTPK